MSTAASGKKSPLQDESIINQIHVLRSLARNGNGQSKQYQITEIAEMCGFKDEKEAQRYLYILEGQKLVSPYPTGDFTSRTWQITQLGVKALKTIDKETVQ